MFDMDIPAFNFTNLSTRFIEYSIQPYVTVLGFFFWPVVFCGVIAYIYLKNQSAVAGAVAILIIFGGFVAEGIFTEVPMFVLLMQLFVALIIAGLFVVLFLRRRN